MAGPPDNLCAAAKMKVEIDKQQQLQYKDLSVSYRTHGILVNKLRLPDKENLYLLSQSLSYVTYCLNLKGQRWAWKTKVGGASFEELSRKMRGTVLVFCQFCWSPANAFLTDLLVNIWGFVYQIVPGSLKNSNGLIWEHSTQEWYSCFW